MGSRDFRGKFSNIFRLWRFDKGALIHSIFYRILSVAALVYGLLILVAMGIGQMNYLIKAATAVIWMLFTPQLFATYKGFALAASNGRSFGRFSESYKEIISRNGKRGSAYTAIPFVVLALWGALFIGMLVWLPN